MIKVTERELYHTRCSLHMKGLMGKHRAAVKENLNCIPFEQGLCMQSLDAFIWLRVKQFQSVIVINFVVHGRRWADMD